MSGSGDASVGSTVGEFWCDAGHDATWPLLGSDEIGMSRLTRRRCPLCPEVELHGDSEQSALPGLTQAECDCCGSVWRWSDEDVHLLPGPRIHLR